MWSIGEIRKYSNRPLGFLIDTGKTRKTLSDCHMENHERVIALYIIEVPRGNPEMVKAFKLLK